MESTSPVYKAIEFTAKVHEGQTKKGSDVPFVSHCFTVAAILMKAAAGDEVVAAGLLHDTVEKTDVTIQDISREFGERISSLVEACTDPEGIESWRERKRHSLDSIRNGPRAVKLVMCADKLHNLILLNEGYAQIGDEVWSRYREGKEGRKWFLNELAEVFRPDAEDPSNPELFRQFIDLADDFLRRF